MNNQMEYQIYYLQQEIAKIFEKFKEDLHSRDYFNVNYLLYRVTQKSDQLMLDTKAEIERFFLEDVAQADNFEVRRLEYLLEISTLMGKISGRLLKKITGSN